MNYINFSSLYVNNLTIDALFSLNKSTVDLAKPLVAELGPIGAAAFTQLESANRALGENMNKNQKSALTDEMKKLDVERDEIINEVFRITATFLKSRDVAKKSSASTMQLFLAPYKGLAKLPLDVESGVATELLAKYRAMPGLIAAGEALDVDGLLNEFETKNTQFDEMYLNRNAEYAERNKSASKVKPAAASAYIQFCTAVEQMVNYAPSNSVVALFNKMDELRKKYHVLIGNGKPEKTEAPK